MSNLNFKFRKGYIPSSLVFRMSKVLHGLSNKQRIPFEDRERCYSVLAN